MKRASFAFYSILAAVAAVAPVQAQTVIDFNSLSGTSATYAESGVTFSTATAGTIDFAGSPNGTIAMLPTSGPRPELRADFLSALTGTVSVDLGDFNADGDLLFLELFDSGNTSLGFTSLEILPSDETMHTLSLSSSNIAFAIFGSRAPSVNGSSVFADNFTFGDRSAVPEPATWAMMLIGFGAVGVSMRRRKKLQLGTQAA